MPDRGPATRGSPRKPGGVNSLHKVDSGVQTSGDMDRGLVFSGQIAILPLNPGFVGLSHVAP